MRLPPRAGLRRAAVHRPRHARAVRAGLGDARSRCSSPTMSTVLVDDRRPVHPDPGRQPRDPAANRGKIGGVDDLPAPPAWPTASWSRRRTTRPRDGGFKYNPPHGGPADTDATEWIAARANELHRGRPRRRQADPVRAGARRGADATTSSAPTSTTCRTSSTSTRSGRPACASAPTRSAARRVDYWGAIAERHRPRPDRRQPAGRRHLAVHDARLGRQDPDGLLLAVGDGVPHRARGTHYQIATGNDADSDRHGIVTPDAGLMNPNHYLAVAIDYLFGGARPRLARRRLHRQDPGEFAR